MDHSSNVHLRWNKHQTTLLSVFDALLDSDKLTDCIISAEGKHLRAHKIILSACSPYFEELFIENNEKYPIIILHDVKYDVVKALMYFMYLGEVNVPQDELSSLLKLSESLKIRGLSVGGHADDFNVQKGSGSSESRVPLDSEPASVPCFTSAENQPETEVQSFRGCPPTSSPQKGDSVGGDSISKSIRKYSKSINQRTGQNAFKEVITPDLDNVSQLQSQRQVLPPVQNSTSEPVMNPIQHQSVCSGLESPVREMAVEEDVQFLIPETVLAENSSGTLSVHKQEAPLGAKSEFLESRMEIVEDLTLDDDEVYCDDYTSDKGDIGKVISVCEGITYEESFHTQGNSSVHSQVGNEYFNQMTLTTPETVLCNRFGCHCGKSYKNPESLSRHLNYECGKEPQFQCPRCNKRCSRFDNLKQHMNSRRCQMQKK